MACYHFELNMLGYGAFMTFSDFCKNAFPGMADQAIAKMVGGVDILFFRPDDELASSPGWRSSVGSPARHRQRGA